MYSEKYNAEQHGSYIADWLMHRDMNGDLIGDLPQIGYVVSERGEPIAAGFIRRCEGNYSLLDSLITNPTAPGDMRSSAIDVVVEQLIKISKELGLRSLVAHTKDKNTLVRAKRFGFQVLPHTLISLSLTSGKEVE